MKTINACNLFFYFLKKDGVSPNQFCKKDCNNTDHGISKKKMARTQNQLKKNWRWNTWNKPCVTRRSRAQYRPTRFFIVPILRVTA